MIFPIGHYLGAHFRAGSEEPVGHRVRLGPSLRWLGVEPELLAWMFAHGLGELSDDEPVTRETLIGYGWDWAGTDLTEAVAALLDRRLLIDVDDDPAGFAKAHRLRPLMLSLGREDGEVLLGIAGEPMVALSEPGYAIWRAAQHAPTLWDACQAAGAELPELLEELHGLLGAGVAYLDAVEV